MRSDWIPMELIIYRYHNSFNGNRHQHVGSEKGLSACIADFSKWKFQLKVCWWITTYFSVILVNWIGKSKILQTNTCDRKQGTKQHKYVFAHLPASSKSRLPKQGHLEPSVCPCYRHKLWLFQSLAILYQQQTSHLHVMKKIEKFLREIILQ